MRWMKCIGQKIRLLELIQEAGRTLQRSPALSFFVCFLLAYVLHTWWQYHYLLHLELGSAALCLIVYLWCEREPNLAIGYKRSTLGYGATAMLVVFLWGMRIEATKSFNKWSAPRGQTEVLQTLDKALDEVTDRGDVEALLMGLTLGYVPPSREGRGVREYFVRSGVAHLLAVSGFHLAVVAGVVHLLLMSLPFGRYGRLRRGLVLLFAWGFVALTGWATPTVRAALMLSIYLIGRIFCRPIQFSQLLALSALLQLAYEPNLVQTKSFVLSYAAVLSIHLFYTKILGLFGRLEQPVFRYLWSAMSLTLSAQLGVLPICLYYFGAVSWSFLWVSLPAGLLATLLIPLTLLLMLGAMCGVVLPLISSLVGYLGEIMLDVVALGSSVPALYQVGHCSLLVVWIWWCVLLLVAFYMKLPPVFEKKHTSLLDISI